MCVIVLILTWYLTSPGLKLILAYSWTRLAILVTGEDRGGMSLFLLFLPCPSLSSPLLSLLLGVVGWCEGVVYLTSPGRPTDISLQLGKA